MDVNELLDEAALDPKKLFNEEEYSTLIVNRDGFSKRDNDVTDLMLSLLDKKITRTECEEIYKQLKDLNASNLMVNTIKSSKKPTDTCTLISACWECGLDFTPHFLYFVELACNSDFKIAFEAVTVIQECMGDIDKSILQKANEMMDDSKSKHDAVIKDLRDYVSSRLT